MESPWFSRHTTVETYTCPCVVNTIWRYSTRYAGVWESVPTLSWRRQVSRRVSPRACLQNRRYTSVKSIAKTFFRVKNSANARIQPAVFRFLFLADKIALTSDRKKMVCNNRDRHDSSGVVRASVMDWTYALLWNLITVLFNTGWKIWTNY